MNIMNHTIKFSASALLLMLTSVMPSACARQQNNGSDKYNETAFAADKFEDKVVQADNSETALNAASSVSRHKAMNAASVLPFKVTCSPHDSAEVCALLGKAARLKQKPASWLLWSARQFLGRPYVGGTLDRASEERLVVNLHELDCTTFVEQALAIAECASRGETSFNDFARCLSHIRYVGGKVEYTSRQHYFTVWIDDNVKEGIVKDISGPNPPYTARQTVKTNYMSAHVKSYKMLSAHPEWLPGIRAMEEKMTGSVHPYIPKAGIVNTPLMRQTIHDGDIIAIVTNKKGLDTTHIGIAVWHRDGLHLLNASSIHHKVIEEPMLLKDYMYRHPVQIGIRTARPLF